jgi:hypothetical protein
VVGVLDPLRAVECSFVGFNDLQGDFEELQDRVAQGRQRNGGFSRERIRGV